MIHKSYLSFALGLNKGLNPNLQCDPIWRGTFYRTRPSRWGNNIWKYMGTHGTGGNLMNARIPTSSRLSRGFYTLFLNREGLSGRFPPISVSDTSILKRLIRYKLYHWADISTNTVWIQLSHYIRLTHRVTDFHFFSEWFSSTQLWHIS